MWYVLTEEEYGSLVPISRLEEMETLLSAKIRVADILWEALLILDPENQLRVNQEYNRLKDQDKE